MKTKLFVLCFCLILVVPAYTQNLMWDPGLKAAFHSSTCAHFGVFGAVLFTKNELALKAYHLGVSVDIAAAGRESLFKKAGVFGVGAGLIDPAFIRLFAKYQMVNDFEKYNNISVELAKDFAWNDYNVKTSLLYSEADGIEINGNPWAGLITDLLEKEFLLFYGFGQKNWRAKFALSSFDDNAKLPLDAGGVAPSSFPLLLVHEPGMLLRVNYIGTEGKTDDEKVRRDGAVLHLSIKYSSLPCIEARYGLQNYHCFDALYPKDDYITSAHTFALGLRPVLFQNSPIKLGLILDGKYQQSFDNDEWGRDQSKKCISVGGIFHTNPNENSMFYLQLVAEPDGSGGGGALSMGMNMKF